MVKKTIRKHNLKNKKKKTKKKTKKYVRNKSSIYSKSELNNINKIISQLDEDITYVLRGSKREIKKKKKKLFNDFKILNAKRKGQRGGGGKMSTAMKVTAGGVGIAFVILLGLDTFMDLNKIFGPGIYEHSWIPNHSTARLMFPTLLRVAARPIFGAITKKILSHMGCDRYVKQDLTQEQCDAKNRANIEMSQNIRMLQMPVNMFMMMTMTVLKAH